MTDFYAVLTWTDSNGSFNKGTTYDLEESVGNVYVQQGRMQLAEIPTHYGTEKSVFGEYDEDGNLTSFVNKDGTISIVGSLRTQTVRYVTFGDSIANFLTLPGAVDNFSVERTSFPFPASGASSTNKNKNRFLAQDLYPKCNLVGNCGITGQTTTQMLARETESASSTRRAVADVMSLYPDIISYRGLSINNLLSVTSGDWQATANTDIAQAKLLINRLSALGVPLIVHAIYGYGFTGWGSAPANAEFVRLALQKVNAEIRSFISTITGNVYFIDMVKIGVQDSIGQYTPQCQGYGVQDGIHPNGIAGILVAKAEERVLIENFGVSETYYFSGSNFLTDPLFATTTTDANGTYSTALIFDLNNATFTNRSVEIVDGVVCQTGLMNVTSSASNRVGIKPNIANLLADIVANTGYYAYEFDYFIEVISGDAKAIDVLERLDIAKTAAGRVTIDQSFNGIVSRQWYKAVSVPFKFQDSSAALAASNGLTLQVSQNSGLAAANQKYKIGISFPKIIEQTA